jgi:hypothetical protein
LSFAVIRQPINQRRHHIVRQMIQNCVIVLIRFLQAGPPYTAAPFPLAWFA